MDHLARPMFQIGSFLPPGPSRTRDEFNAGVSTIGAFQVANPVSKLPRSGRAGRHVTRAAFWAPVETAHRWFLPSPDAPPLEAITGFALHFRFSLTQLRSKTREKMWRWAMRFRGGRAENQTLPLVWRLIAAWAKRRALFNTSASQTPHRSRPIASCQRSRLRHFGHGDPGTIGGAAAPRRRTRRPLAATSNNVC